MCFADYLAVGYAPVLVMTDLAAVACDSVVAVEFAVVGIEDGTEIVETEVDNSVVDTEVVDTEVDNSVFVDTGVDSVVGDTGVDSEVVEIEAVDTVVAELMIDGVVAADTDVHHRARCNASHPGGICNQCVDCTHDLHYLHGLGEQDVCNGSRVPDSKVFCASLLVFDILCT